MLSDKKMSSDVSYIKCNDGTLYLSAVKDYFNNEIVSYSTSNNNDVNLILESYKDLNIEENATINTDQGAVYFSYEYVELAKIINLIEVCHTVDIVGKIVLLKIGLCN